MCTRMSGTGHLGIPGTQTGSQVASLQAIRASEVRGLVLVLASPIKWPIVILSRLEADVGDESRNQESRSLFGLYVATIKVSLVAWVQSVSMIVSVSWKAHLSLHQLVVADEIHRDHIVNRAGLRHPMVTPPYIDISIVPRVLDYLLFRWKMCARVGDGHNSSRY
jgi:hypothetical protein